MVSPNVPLQLESNLQKLMNCVPLGIVLLDAEKRAVSTNLAWCNLTGLPPATLDWKGAFTPTERSRISEALHRLNAEDSSYRAQVPLHRPAKPLCWIELDIVPERAATGAIEGWVVTARDITAAREARIALEAESRRYRLLTEASNDMVVRITLDGVRLYVSSACSRILGYEPDELLGATPIATIHPEDRARVERTCRSLLQGAQDPICSYRQLRRDGSYVWLEASYRLVRDDADGRPVEFVATVRDISTRRSAELSAARQYAELEESKRQLELSEATAHLGHWNFDLATGLVRWSNEVFRIHGLTPAAEAPSFETVMSYYHPDDEAAVRVMIAQAASYGTPYSFRARLVRVDGTCIHIAAEGRVELAPNGQPVGLFGVVQDITKQVEIERALEEARDAARALAEAQSLFVATMSHEIRTPMTGIVGLVETLSDAMTPTQRARTIANLQASATSLIEVLDDVLDHAELENGKLQIETRVFDLTLVVEQTIDLFRPAALSKGLTLTVSTPALVAQGDPVRLRQIISNFISNAIKFTTTGKIDVIVTASPAGRVSVRVEDQGIGISAEVLARLFKPFTQADASIRRTYGGSGLGLSITRQLATMMGGLVDATSVPGEGSCFWVELPLNAREGRLDRVVEAGASDIPPLQIEGRRPSVLVIDDTATTRLVCEAHLTALGCDATSAEDGIAALAMLAAFPYDAILLDSAMPVLDGATVARCARLMPGHENLIIVGFTAHALPAQQQPLLAAGIDAILIKPFLIGNLRRTLEKAFEARRTVAAPAAAAPMIPSTFEREEAEEIAAMLQATRGSREALLLRVADAQRFAATARDASLQILADSALAVLANHPLGDADPLIDLMAQRLAPLEALAA